VLAVKGNGMAGGPNTKVRGRQMDDDNECEGDESVAREKTMNEIRYVDGDGDEDFLTEEY
jgi:hypothetical protein